MKNILMTIGAVFGGVAPVMIDSAWKSGAVLLAVLLVTGMILRKQSAAVRHWVWVLGILILLGLPLVSWLTPKVALEIPGVERVMSGAAEMVSDEGTPRFASDAAEQSGEVGTAVAVEGESIVKESLRAWPWAEICSALWLVGSLLLLARLGWSWVSLCRRAGRGEGEKRKRVSALLEEIRGSLEIEGAVGLAISPGRGMPMACGIVRSRILLPEEAERWEEDKLRSVLTHELGHVKRRDPLVQLLVQVACALYWWNPLVWVAAHRLYVERERACDDLVLGRGVKASEYAAHLLEMVTRYGGGMMSPAGAVTMAKKSRFEGRLVALLHGGMRRGGVTRRAVTCGLVGAALLGTGVAVLTAVEDEEAEKEAGSPVFAIFGVAEEGAPGARAYTVVAEGADDEPVWLESEALIADGELGAFAVERNAEGMWEVHVSFTEEGDGKLAEATGDRLGERLGLVIGGELWSAPRVMARLAGGPVVISGNFSRSKIEELVAVVAEAGYEVSWEMEEEEEAGIDDAANEERPWTAVGRVTDGEGVPMVGVVVEAKCGSEGLQRTGQAVTDEEGRYRLRFGPDTIFSDEKGVQKVLISAEKAGFYEVALNRGGTGVGVLEKPESKEGIQDLWGHGIEDRLFEPGDAVEIDFEIRPAARVEVRISGGRPEGFRGETKVVLTGDTLPPGSRFLEARAYQEGGSLYFVNVPLGVPFVFQMHDGNMGWVVESRVVRFQRPGDHWVTLVADMQDIRVENMGLVYGQVEGELILGGKPARGVEVEVRYPGGTEGDEGETRSGATNREGWFAVSNIPLGRAWVVPKLLIADQAQPDDPAYVADPAFVTRREIMVPGLGVEVQVDRGRPARVTLGGVGRPVVGQVLAVSGAEADWRGAKLRVYPEAFVMAMQQPGDDWHFVRRFLESDEGAPYWQDEIPVSEDGSFRIDRVPAGRWVVQIYNDEGSKDLEPVRFEVPAMRGGESSEVLDLGTLKLLEPIAAGGEEAEDSVMLTKRYLLRHVRAADVEKILDEAWLEGNNKTTVTVLDERTNSLVVQGMPSDLERIDLLLGQLDEKPEPYHWTRLPFLYVTAQTRGLVPEVSEEERAEAPHGCLMGPVEVEGFGTVPVYWFFERETERYDVSVAPTTAQMKLWKEIKKRGKELAPKIRGLIQRKMEGEEEGARFDEFEGAVIVLYDEEEGGVVPWEVVIHDDEGTAGSDYHVEMEGFEPKALEVVR
jgi:beta-lactamase regulating signal transducer with metallopeptidase domain